jgi:hypothetical protein
MIKIIDALMGTGKTTKMIDEMNAHPEQLYMVVVPFLKECKRIINGCPALNFVEPSDDKHPKSASLKMLVRDGRNIVVTHKLFSKIELAPALYEQIKAYGYT